ncbi:hypothetical protein U2I54_20475 [Bacillus pseudomycoides]|uniref:Uncharacterized protein n=1 Tax=Bacillus bingmayongensis TaxID=1150157 RepID=A0ABU5K0X0_9BACI|nr:hypothetical protein [Bacillus pseudomycoides]
MGLLNKNGHEKLYGYDVGIEQEGIRLLEELENELEDGVDWSIIQGIEEDLVASLIRYIF